MTIDWILIAGDFLSVHLTQHSVVIHQLLLQPEYDPASPGAISHQPWGTASTIRNFEQLLVNVNKFGQINPIIGICSIQNQECELFVIVCGLIWWNDVHTYILKPCKRTYSYILFPYYLYIYCTYIYIYMAHVILHIIDDTSQWIQVYFLKSYSLYNIFPNLETTCRNITRRWLLNGSGPQN